MKKRKNICEDCPEELNVLKKIGLTPLEKRAIFDTIMKRVEKIPSSPQVEEKLSTIPPTIIV